MSKATHILLVCDSAVQLWLIEICCHASATSFYFGGGNESYTAIKAAEEYFANVSAHNSASREMRAYHLIISGFHFLRYASVDTLTFGKRCGLSIAFRFMR